MTIGVTSFQLVKKKSKIFFWNFIFFYFGYDLCVIFIKIPFYPILRYSVIYGKLPSFTVTVPITKVVSATVYALRDHISRGENLTEPSRQQVTTLYLLNSFFSDWFLIGPNWLSIRSAISCITRWSAKCWVHLWQATLNCVTGVRTAEQSHLKENSLQTHIALLLSILRQMWMKGFQLLAFSD